MISRFSIRNEGHDVPQVKSSRFFYRNVICRRRVPGATACIYIQKIGIGERDEHERWLWYNESYYETTNRIERPLWFCRLRPVEKTVQSHCFQMKFCYDVSNSWQNWPLRYNRTDLYVALICYLVSAYCMWIHRKQMYHCLFDIYDSSKRTISETLLKDVGCDFSSVNELKTYTFKGHAVVYHKVSRFPQIEIYSIAYHIPHVGKLSVLENVIYCLFICWLSIIASDLIMLSTSM